MEITQLLTKIRGGDNQAYNELYPLVYDKLKAVAMQQLNKEYPNSAICKTELVHETYGKMVDQDVASYLDRAHFFAIAARSMRQILVDIARKKNAAKRGGNLSRVDMELQDLQADQHAEQILALHELLIRLKEIDERLCTVVELRFFVGLSIEETSKVLNISTATVNRDWLKARAWLYQHLNEKI
ncbi:MAG: sigma-70 family RNA polymerase sigma factor [Balneolaceae bacterium]|nr:MAG: sigma-70 family RNA polymerase sigma factor [Balneolaceae bacterium]